MKEQLEGAWVMEVRLLKGREVAAVLGVSVSFAYLLMKRGDIPTIRLGRAVRVRFEDLERYIKEQVARNKLACGQSLITS